ncbi:hypothetical protein AB4Z09_08910 [Rhodococcus sp. TAF43]|uniref:hypothetical protein n=1 Tax=unclassified Rhodococcus (in: high G+C Gram-positive bacteria) TaxID=192944 RepID=UPI00158152E4|nr:hypothetical protein [Rhodococcus sp. W8901]QKT10384.1 hypothetical protein HUN07_06355 [Rhodococcus sp. W8901]
MAPVTRRAVGVCAERSPGRDERRGAARHIAIGIAISTALGVVTAALTTRRWKP